jgi:AcrR family transcriptional regulator
MVTPDARRDGKVTREVVLSTALDLIDRDGAAGLSMRRLARALNRDPMILYRHAPNKAALLDGVVEVVLAQLNVDPADPDWAAQLRAVARDYRQLALAHPHVVTPRPRLPPDGNTHGPPALVVLPDCPDRPCLPGSVDGHRRAVAAAPPAAADGARDRRGSPERRV